MISIAIALAWSFLSPAPQPDCLTWPQVLALDSSNVQVPVAHLAVPPVAAPSRAMVLAQRAQSPSQGISFSTADPYVMTEEEQREWEQWNLWLFNTRESALDAAKGGDEETATRILEGMVAAEPDRMNGIVLCPLADLYFYAGRPAQAQAVLAPACHPGIDKSTLLRASLAAARQGVVYPGQREFVLSWIVGKDILELAPRGLAPRAGGALLLSVRRRERKFRNSAILLL